MTPRWLTVTLRRVRLRIDSHYDKSDSVQTNTTQSFAGTHYVFTGLLLLWKRTKSQIHGNYFNMGKTNCLAWTSLSKNVDSRRLALRGVEFFELKFLPVICNFFLVGTVCYCNQGPRWVLFMKKNAKRSCEVQYATLNWISLGKTCFHLDWTKNKIKTVI